MEKLKTGDGSHTLKSTQFDVTYHSIHGALQETQTVFIDAALLHKAEEQQELSILGIGFGTGLNALMTYLEAKTQGLKITYTGVEAYPISVEMAKTLNYLDCLDAKEEEAIFLSMHEGKVELDFFDFTKRVELFQNIEDKGVYDIIYFDAFAPNAQPELWEESMLTKMYEALKDNGVLVSYCAKGVFKRTLRKVGFLVEGLPGPKGKREMTRAVKEVS